MQDRVTLARDFAIAAHGDQRYGTDPYSFHLDAVAALVSMYGEDAQVVAYLHDVVEDTPVKIELIREKFGDMIAACVSLLTDEPRINRKERKARTNAKLQTVSTNLSLVLIVKAADRLANLRAAANSSDASKLQMYGREHAPFRDGSHCRQLTGNRSRVRCAFATRPFVEVSTPTSHRSRYHGPPFYKLSPAC
jgi:(p)ppGpp synthase/HD superfamily hydrolase